MPELPHVDIQAARAMLQRAFSKHLENLFEVLVGHLLRSQEAM
jgi:hypothetical protein